MVSPTWESLKDFYPPKPTYLPDQYPDLTGKLALVTGSNSGIGYETAKALLKQNATVVFVNRNIEKTKSAIEKIKTELGNIAEKQVISIRADLSDLSTIKPAVEELTTKYGIKKLHYIILNAGVLQPPNGTKTAQGYELQIGTNVLGHHLLQKLLHPLVLNGATPTFNPRVVWVASSAHFVSYQNGGIKWDSFRDASEASTMRSYGQSKTGNIYQAYEYAQQTKKDGIISVAVHPGYLKSELQRTYSGFQRAFMNKLFYETVYGSYSELFGALSPDVTLEKTGSYIGPWGVFRHVRDDVQEGFTDGTSKKFWDWADGEVKQYL